MEGLFPRLEGLYGGLDGLKDKKVVLIGLGSGGNEIALDLVRCDVGAGKGGGMILIDPDTLSLANLSRYTACRGLEDVGRPKVEVVGERLRGLIPEINLSLYPEEVQQAVEGNRNLLEGVDLIVSATGSIQANLWINRLAWEAGIPAVYGGVWERGFGGEVLRVVPGETPCYDCVLGQVELPKWDAEATQDYGLGHGPGEEPDGETALCLDVRHISLIQSRVALLTCLGRYDLPSNYLLIGNRNEWIFRRPFQVLFVTPAKRESCGTCGASELLGLSSQTRCSQKFMSHSGERAWEEVKDGWDPASRPP